MQTGNLKGWLERFYFDVEPNFKGVRDFQIVPVRGLDFYSHTHKTKSVHGESWERVQRCNNKFKRLI